MCIHTMGGCTENQNHVRFKNSHESDASSDVNRINIKIINFMDKKIENINF